jgi:enamine deaminase RidA (YjgF/YER057c/UK114 family)
VSQTKVLQPPGWLRPKGYSNGMCAQGQQVYIAGQIGRDAMGRFRSERLADQVRQALQNIVDVLSEANGRPEHLVRLTWYITSRDEYLLDLKGIGEAYRTVIGRHFPPMSVVQVVALVEPLAKVEIEATAVVPESAHASV